MTIPSVEDRPEKQCPQLRGTACNAYRRASEIASATSVEVSQDMMASGRVSWKRAIAGWRADS
jgi:hypothetical protein